MKKNNCISEAAEHRGGLLLDLLGRRKEVGISRNSTVKEVFDKLGQPEEGWEEDRILTYLDLEIGLDDEGEAREISYIGIYPGKNDSERFEILNMGSEELGGARYEIKKMEELLKKNGIKFKYDNKKFYNNEQKCIISEFGDELYFMNEGCGVFHMRSAFLTSI